MLFLLLTAIIPNFIIIVISNAVLATRVKMKTENYRKGNLYTWTDGIHTVLHKQN